MECSNNKGLVGSYAMVRFFLYQLCKDNLIDTDTNVIALNIIADQSAKLAKTNEFRKDVLTNCKCWKKEVKIKK